MPRWLIIASWHDRAAHWAHRGLAAQGNDCELLWSERLESAEVTWRHRVETGSASVEISLADGGHLQTGDFAAVLNRMITPPMTGLARVNGADSVYARSEQVAFALSWLQALAPVVVNPPAPRGLAGAWRSAAEWRALALAAGFSVEPLISDSHAAEPFPVFPLAPPDILVIGDEAFGQAAEPEVAAPAIRLARLACTPILGLWLNGRELTTATPHPDLSLGGERGHDALARLLDR